MVILGGLGSIPGVIVGAAVVVILNLQVLQGLCNNVVTVGFGIFSFLLVAAFSYRLGGIWGGDKFSTALTAIGAWPST